jgi:hypothetical protein
VLPEALASGLLPIVHDYQITREVLQNHGVFQDMTRQGSLKDGIDAVDHANLSKELLIDYADNNFSWRVLSNRYKQMINQQLDIALRN